MQYVEYISKEGKYAKLWFTHSVFIKGDYVLSYEMSWLLSKWKYKIYKREDWVHFVSEITHESEVPDANILQYEWIELEWFTCFEALEIVQGIPTIKSRLKHILRWTLIASIFWVAMFLWGYYWFTMSEEEYLSYKTEICQE